MGGFSGVLEGLKLAEQKRQTNLQAQVDRERTAAQAQLDMERVKQEQDRLKQQAKEFDLSHKLAIKTAEAIRQAHALESMRAEAELNPSTIRELEAAKQGPIVEGRIKEIEATKSADFERTMMQKIYDDARNKETQDANALIQAAHDRTRIEAARISAAGKATESLDISNAVERGINGTSSVDDLRKELGARDSLRAFNAISQLKARPLTKLEVEELGEYQDVQKAVNLWDQFLNIQPAGTTWTEGIKSGISTQFESKIKNLQDQLLGRSLLIAKSVSKQSARSISDKDAKIVAAGYLPSRFKPKDENIKTRNNFVRDMNIAIDTKFKGMSPQQRSLIKKNLGLLEIPLYSESSSQQQQQQVPSANQQIKWEDIQ